MATKHMLWMMAFSPVRKTREITVTGRRILEVLFNPRRAKRTPDGGWKSQGLTHRAIASLLDLDQVTVRRVLFGPRGLVAKGWVRIEPVMRGGRRTGTIYYAPDIAPAVPGSLHYRTVLKEALANLGTQLAAMESAREQTLATIASIEELLGRRKNGESSGSAGN